jgi:TRAP-type C4-dicarboxylate transport system permease small subunit
MRAVGTWLRRRAENAAAIMLGVMFGAFVLQVLFRYVFNFPIGWTSELTVALWLWIVLWGASFVLKETEEVRFDLLTAAVGPRVRSGMAAVCAVALLVLYGASLPASYSYVSFMKVERAAYLKVPLSWLYCIYVVFLVAILVRYAWLLVRLLRGGEAEEADITHASGGL